VETVNTDDLTAFLARYAPFDALAPEALREIAAQGEERVYEPGETLLLEDGAPAERLSVVVDGAVELVHENEVVDLLGPGESFGHPSLLSGLAPAFTVRTRERTVAVLFPLDAAVAVFSGPGGVGYLASSLRQRMVQTGHVVHALPELGTIRVAELITRPPVFCEGSVTIRRAAETMTESGSSAILVRDGRNLSILTDAVLRERVVAGEMSTGSPVSLIVRPAVQVRPEEIAVDAVVDMLDAGTDHVAVVDNAGTVLGVLSASDLAGLETRSPFALRHAILAARDEDELVAAAARLRPLFLALLDARVAPLDVGRVLSLQADSLTRRLLELAIARLGPAPAAWAWIALGSTARRELTLGSDQENALAYDGADAGVDAYFAELSADVTRGLVRCGFALDPNDVVASNALWRLSLERWEEVFRECLESPDRSHLIRANVAFDFRKVAGALDATPPLVAVLRDARNHPDLLRRLARSATDFKPPLGFRGSLANGKGLDLKQGGTIPIANLARFFALSNAITISNTVDRLTAVQEAGALDAETATALREAFEIVMRIRLDNHAAQLEAGAEPTNVVVSGSLPPLTRVQLREAFKAIAAAQKLLSVYVPLGM
jgi:CBS domain-containing protein